MTRIADKWDRLHAASPEPGRAAHVLTCHRELLPTSGAALDVACGTGANTFFLASQGLSVTAWDISSVAIAELQKRSGEMDIQASIRDISADDFQPGTWDLIVTCHYLDRSILPAMRDALTPGGLLCYQTFTREKVADIGPSNPDFLLAPGELEALAGDLEILVLEDASDETDTAKPLAGRACLIARKPFSGERHRVG